MTAGPAPAMRALRLIADRKLELAEVPAPPPPGAGEVQIRIKAVALNHLDLWGFRGMAFAKRKLPLVVGAEASGEIAAVGAGVTGFKPGDKVVMYGAMTCGHCAACREGRDNLCENVGGIMGFHIDGFARDLINLPARLVIPVPAGVSLRDAACAPIAFGTVEHMLFDNAKLKPGETILVHAGGSGIGSVAIKMAKAIGCTVITTVGDDAKAEKAKALGADHVINYKTERFEGVTRKLTAKKGVDVVFEHVGGEGFNASLLCLKRGGRLVTCGSTAGPTVTINLMQLFQQQYKIFGSFGASMRNIRDSLAKIAAGMTPIIDTEVAARRFRARAWRGSKAGRCSAKSSCIILMRDADRSRHDPAAAPRRQTRRRRGCIGALAVGSAQAAAAASIPTGWPNFAGWMMRMIGPLLPENRIAPRQSHRRFSGEIRRRDRSHPARAVWDNLGRMGAEFAHLDRLWDYDPAHPERRGRIDVARRPDIERFKRLARTASRR